jgi:hypothetical protein
MAKKFFNSACTLIGLWLLELEHALAISGEPSDPPPDASSWEIERSTDIKRLLTHCAGCFVEIKNKTTPFLDGKQFSVPILWPGTTG